MTDEEREAVKGAIAKAMERGWTNLSYAAPETWPWRWTLIVEDLTDSVLGALEPER